MILITGAAGYVGGHLINSILADERFEGYEIIGIDNFIVGKEENYKLIQENPSVNLGKGDITDREDVRKMLKDVEIVYHLASISDVVYCNNNPKEAGKINVNGTLFLLEEARRRDVEYFIFPSSAAVYGNCGVNPINEDIPPKPQNVYAALKVAGEALCDAYHNSYGIGTVVLRWTNIYGKGTYFKWRTVVSRFVRKAYLGEPLTVHGSGNQRRNFIHIDDAVSLYKAVITQKAKGERFNAGSTENASINRLIEIIKKVAKKEYNRELTVTYTRARDSDPEREFDISIKKLEEKLGWRAKISLEEGVRKTFKAFDEEIKKGGPIEAQREPNFVR